MDHTTKRQITLYYLNTLLIGTWFTSGVTLFFCRRFLTDASIGWMDAIALGVGLLAEIPSGTVADRLGRRRTVMAGVVLMGVGFAAWGLAVSAWMVLLGVMLYAVGGSLQSGADEAMMYDYLKAHAQESVWPRISANGAIIARLAYVVSIAVGGIAYVAYDRLPFLMRAITFFLMIIPLVQMAVIDKYQEAPAGESKRAHFLTDMRQGVKELFQPGARWLIPLYVMVQGVSYTVFTAGILRPLLYEKSGLAVAYHSFAISIALVLTVLTMLALRRIVAKQVHVPVVFALASMCAIGFAASIGRLPLMLPLLGLTILQVATYSLMPVLSTALNASISSRYRATTLSAASFAQCIAYVVTAPVVGFLSSTGHINQVAIGATLVVAVGVGLAGVLKGVSTQPAVE